MKYPLNDGEQVYQNPQIMQMVYALEWYDIPRKDYGSLVEYHPYLTHGDQMRLEQLNSETLMHQSITFGLSSIIANRFLLNRRSKFFSKYM